MTIYELETYKLLHTESFDVVDYLKSCKNKRKSQVFYLSKEVNNIEGSKQALRYYITFTEDYRASKLDILQQEMSNRFVTVESMHLEEFIEWLMHHLSVVSEYNKLLKQGVKYE